MKTTRTQLIEQAARDNADEGTEWRERMDRWLDWQAKASDPANRTQRFGPTWHVSNLSSQ